MITKKMVNDSIMAAYIKLSPEEKREIDKHIAYLKAGITARSSTSQFGKSMGIETLGTIGMAMLVKPKNNIGVETEKYLDRNP